MHTSLIYKHKREQNDRKMRKNVSSSMSVPLEQVASSTVFAKSESVKKVGKLVKSPLRYPGGKSRAIKTILDLIPPDINTLASPFTGGASIELAVASKLGVKVYGYDLFEPLVAFWQTLIENSTKLAEMVKNHYPLTRTEFYDLQNRFTNMESRYEIATAFFVLNRSSFSGTSLSGGMSPNHPRFTESAIERLSDFKIDGFSVEHSDFKESIPRHENDFLYLDPPYANGGALYGNKGDCHVDFDHETLAEMLRKRHGWLLSYNDCELIRDLYKGHTFIRPEWTYGMSNNKSSNEVLILSHD